MTELCPDHYSRRFFINIHKRPAKATDRVSRLLLLASFVLGLMLCLLGSYHFMTCYACESTDIEKNLIKSKIVLPDFVLPDLFNFIIILVGIGIMLTSFVYFFRRKVIEFNGSNIAVRHHFLFKKTYCFEEPLYNYEGVRLRLKFSQYGLMNKNKYIIELYHKDPNKIVPLYIATTPRKLRERWKNFAQELHMPGITLTEKGMLSRNHKDLDRSYAKVIENWHLPPDFLIRKTKPDYISFKYRHSGEKMIKIQKTFLDAYMVLSALTILISGCLFVYALTNHALLEMHLPTWSILGGYALLLTISMYCFLFLVSKDILLITHQQILIFRKILFFRIRDGIIDLSDIKGVDISYIPTADSYYLSVISDKNAHIIGRRLPPQDLRWIRALIINEIMSRS